MWIVASSRAFILVSSMFQGSSSFQLIAMRMNTNYFHCLLKACSSLNCPKLFGDI